MTAFVTDKVDDVDQMYGTMNDDTANNCHNNAKQNITTDANLTNDDEKHDDEADQEGTHSISEMQNDDAFSDGNYNNDNVSFNTQLMGNQNEFDDDNDDSQEDSEPSDIETDKIGTHSTIELQNDSTFSDGDYDDDNDSLNMQLMDNQNEFDDDDSQEDS
eukprot:5779387-Ditylum_brightwellii.AAC.1